jgi:hypothetical protein
MGYNNDIRSLIYGDPDIVGAFVAKHKLSSTLAFTTFDGDIRIYDRIQRRFGEPPLRITIIDFRADSIPWYDDSPPVASWTDVVNEAVELGLSYELIRVGDSPEDVDHESDGPACNHWLSVRTEICSYVEADTLPVEEPTDDTNPES